MSSSRRAALESIKFKEIKNKKPHAGLWLDKFLTHQEKPRPTEESTYTQLVKECSQIKKPSGYKTFYTRWKETVEGLGVKTQVVRVNGRLAIGLGNETVIETGVTLHHTYGVPIIPGSALKGVASSYAHQYLDTIWQKNEDAHNTLFGSTESAGFVTFFDALPVFDQWKLEPDVMTVHHADYYQDASSAPADWDSPIIIPFLTVTGDFLIALHAPDAPGWADVAYGILKSALDEIGVGAKTSSGYGRIDYYKRGIVDHFGGVKTPSYGRIFTDQQKTETIFVHRTNLRKGVSDLKAGDVVDYKVGRGKNGRKQAQDVHFP